MQRHESGRLYDPHPIEPAGLGEIIDIGIRMFRLGLGGLLCLTGFFLAIQVFFAAYDYVTEPEQLQAVLAAWDAPPSTPAEPEKATPEDAPPPPTAETPVETAEPTPSAPVGPPSLPEDSEWFVDTANTIVDDLAQGRLARPIGGFVMFLFMTILVQVALGMIRVGSAVLQGARGTSTNPSG